MTERDDDFNRGLKNRRRVLGDGWVDQSSNRATELDAEFQELITRNVWHGIWSRPGLDHPTRRLLVLAMTMAQGRWEEFELHVRAALEGGIALATIKEVLLQGAAYCGVPAANTAFKLTAAVCRTLGIALEPAPLSAPARVQTHHTFSAPSLRVAVQGPGHGVPVVLAHALGLDLSMWQGLAASLAGDHPVLRYDHRGHGGSAAAHGPYTMEALVDDAARVVREWGVGSVVFVGLSMGGMVAQGLAIRHPDLVRGLVLANTTSAYGAAERTGWADRIALVRGGGMAAIADAVVQRFLSAPYRAAHPEAAAGLHACILCADAAGYVAACEAVSQLDWTGLLATVRCPTAVIAGSEDAGTPPAMGQAIADRIPGASFDVLQGAAHLAVVEMPQAFEQIVRRLIERV